VAAAFGGLIDTAALLFCVLALAATNLWIVHARRASLGKLVFKLRVVRADGSEADFWRILLLRWLPAALLAVVPVYGWGVLLIDSLFIFGTARRCVHDYLADTVVVDAV
jgi:uncharacterized RDD family membrane protein YckC